MPRPRLVALAAALTTLVATSCGDVPEPDITFFADQEAVVAYPVLYCSLDLRDCTTGEDAQLSIPPGKPLQISLPKEIAGAPWRLITIFLDATGEQRSRERFYAPDERVAVTLRLGPAEQLQGVEIQLPSAAVDENGNPVARAAWALQNTYAP